MSERLKRELAEAKALVKALQEELLESNRGTTLLTLELEEKAEDLQEELLNSSSGMTALAVELEEKSADLAQLNCLYGISNLVSRQGVSVEEILQETADLLPPAWQYPEITCARIILEGREFRTKNFKETIWKQRSDISVHGERKGSLEVCYLKETPQRDEGPFLNHEKILINIIAERLANMIEYKRAQEELREHREHLEELVKSRTNELEEKSAELERANISVQEADRLKSIFLASMSHELRTPLNSIIGFTGIILQGMVGKVNKEQRKQLTMVKNSANHLLSLINDLLDISKVEAGKVELSLEEFELDDIVSEVVETVSPTASEKSLELLTHVPKGITLFSDSRRVKQVLMNLASNAVKFTEQGNVKIAARILKDEKLEVRVTDTGIGIKKEDMNKLFAPFQQIDVSLTKQHEGTGLGLHLTKKLVALLRGDIWAKSEYGRGSELTFVLPLRHEEEQRNEENTGC